MIICYFMASATSRQSASFCSRVVSREQSRHFNSISCTALTPIPPNLTSKTHSSNFSDTIMSYSALAILLWLYMFTWEGGVYWNCSPLPAACWATEGEELLGDLIYFFFLEKNCNNSLTSIVIVSPSVLFLWDDWHQVYRENEYNDSLETRGRICW